MLKFAVGDRVAFVNGQMRFTEDGDGPSCGTVIVASDVLPDGTVMVKWDSAYKGHTAVNPSQLLPEAEANEKWSKLEADFDRVTVEVKAKLSEAGKLIAAADQFATDNGFDIQKLWKATGVLEKAMENAGWNTSSWHC